MKQNLILFNTRHLNRHRCIYTIIKEKAFKNKNKNLTRLKISSLPTWLNTLMNS